MPKETMTPRERWLAVLQRETPDRVPMSYWTTPEARDKLMKHLGVSDEQAMLKRLHIDRPVGKGILNWMLLSPQGRGNPVVGR